ncbi:hypothetical protein T09_12029 [Trichinella sp. T9]|nr:hypothetical protein T09_12029 [Trichinella sp. T9]
MVGWYVGTLRMYHLVMEMDGTLVKKCNCTLLDKLPTMCNESLKTWDELLLWIMLAYNSRVHEITRVTPLFASLGKELMLPLDVQLGIGVFLLGPTFLLLVFAHAILLDRQIFVVLVFLV